jgi:hypothetical protein
MWKPDQIVVDLQDVDSSEQPPVALVRIATPIGIIELLGAIWFNGRTLHVNEVHVGGLSRGACGRDGLNAIGRKLLEVADVDQIIIQGATRTTGCNAGRIPKVIRFPNGKAYADG